MTAPAFQGPDESPEKVVNLQTGEVRDLVKPTFEGNKVTGSYAKISTLGLVDIEDRNLKIDDQVRLTVEGKVVGVGHEVDPKTGVLNRVHKIKVDEVTYGTFGAAGPDGVLR